MITLVVCDCHNSETIARRVLQEAGLPDWLDYPCLKGKEQGKSFAKGLGSCLDLSKRYQLTEHLEHTSTYACIVGYDDAHAVWVDVGSGKLKEQTEARAVAKLFA